MKKVFISSVSIYLGRLSQILFGFLTSVYVVRYLSTQDYGAYKLIHTILLFSTYFTSLGLESTLGRYIPEFITKGRYKTVNRLISLALLLRIFAVLLLFGFLAFFRDFIFSFFNFPTILIVWFPAIFILIFLNRIKTLIGSQLLAAYIEHYLDNVNKIGSSVLRFALFLMVVKNNWGLEGLILSTICVDFLSFLYYLFFAVKKYLHNARLARNSEITSPETHEVNLRRIGRYAAFSYLSTSSDIFKEILIDNFVISHYMNMSAVGIYSFAASLIEIPRSFNPTNLLRSLFVPLLVRSYYKNGQSIDTLKFFYDLMNKVFLLISFPFYLTIGILAKEIVTYVFAVKYLPAVPIVYIFVASYIIGDMVYTFRPIINVLEKTELLFLSSIFSAYNLIMDIVLIKHLGLIGVAIATGSAAVLQYLYFFAALRVVSGPVFRFPFKSILKSVLNFCPSLAFLFIYRKSIDNIWQLLFAFVVTITLYLLFSYYNRIFTREELDFLRARLGRNFQFIRGSK